MTSPQNMPTERRRELERAALAGWVARDEGAVAVAMDALVMEGTPRDALLWAIDLVYVAYGSPSPDMGKPGVVVSPMVATWNEEGAVVPVPLDEAPLGARTYAQIAAAYYNQDPETILALYRVLLERDTPEDFQMFLACALSQAGQRVQAKIASDQ